MGISIHYLKSEITQVGWPAMKTALYVKRPSRNQIEANSLLRYDINKSNIR